MTRHLALLVTTLALGGCSLGLERPYPDCNYYTIAARDLGALPSSTGENRVIRVGRARVAPPFGSRMFQHRVGEDRYQADYYERWADDPGALISATVREALAASRQFQAVLDDGTSADGETLELYVTALYVDATHSGTPHAVLTLQATVIGTDGTIRTSRDYEASAPATSRAGDALVAAWNAALESVLDDLLADLRT